MSGRPSIRVFVSPRHRWMALLYLALVVALLVGGSIFVGRTIPQSADPAVLRAYVAGFGLLAPLAFVGLQAAQVVLAPIPGAVLGLVSGYLFGAVLGTAYSLLGATIGSYIAFRLARHFGRPFVERVVHPDTLARFDELSERRGLLALFVVFLIPGLPDDAICFVGGLTDIDIRQLVAVSAVGRLPGFFLVNLVGAQLADQRIVEAAVLAGSLAFLTVLGYLGREWIGRQLGFE